MDENKECLVVVEINWDFIPKNQICISLEPPEGKPYPQYSHRIYPFVKELPAMLGCQDINEVKQILKRGFQLFLWHENLKPIISPV